MFVYQLNISYKYYKLLVYLIANHCCPLLLRQQLHSFTQAALLRRFVVRVDSCSCSFSCRRRASFVLFVSFRFGTIRIAAWKSVRDGTLNSAVRSSVFVSYFACSRHRRRHRLPVNRNVFWVVNQAETQLEFKNLSCPSSCYYYYSYYHLYINDTKYYYCAVFVVRGSAIIIQISLPLKIQFKIINIQYYMVCPKKESNERYSDCCLCCARVV